MLDERSFQTVSTPFNIFNSKENVESMLNESLNQFKIDSTSFQNFFTLSTMLNDLFKPAPDIWFNNCAVGRMMKQMLKSFKRTLTLFFFMLLLYHHLLLVKKAGADFSANQKF